MAKGKYQEWLTKEGLLKLESWARDGLTNEQIAQNIGITRKTLQEWIVKYSDISDTLKRGKEIVDIQVENALLKRALGYDYEEVTKERLIKKDIKGDSMIDLHGFPVSEMIVTKIVTKQVVADTTAQIFWLKNRKPKEWRDKQEISHIGAIPVQIIDNIPEDDEDGES